MSWSRHCSNITFFLLCTKHIHLFVQQWEIFHQTGRSSNHEKWKHLIVFLFFICVSINLTKKRSYFICGFLNFLLIFWSQLLVQMRGAHLMSVLSNRNVYSCYLKIKKNKKSCLQTAHAWSAEFNWDWIRTIMMNYNNHLLCSTRCLLWFCISRAACIEWWLLLTN